MDESVLLGKAKPLVDSIRHSIRDLSCVFSVSRLQVSYRSLTSRFAPFCTLLNELGFLCRSGFCEQASTSRFNLFYYATKKNEFSEKLKDENMTGNLDDFKAFRENARSPLWRAPAGNHGRCIHQTMHET